MHISAVGCGVSADPAPLSVLPRSVKQPRLRARATDPRSGSVHDAGETRHDIAENALASLRELVPKVRYFAGLPACSTAMNRVFDMLERLSPTELTMTLFGETGTGKDVLAQAIHCQSRRSKGPIVVFDCGAVAPALAESELFGHERGAFTGAIASHAGAFERAHGGTLLLDEIGELPLDLQPRLLRAVESRSVRRVGGTEDRALDVRILAATNRDLRLDVAAGRFRQDLFFRLAAIMVPVPPLRERCEDVPLLVARLLEDLGRPDLRVAESVYGEIGARRWPGNLRELKNVLACALTFVDGDVLYPSHLGAESVASEAGPSYPERLPLGGHKLHDIERAAIEQTLRHVGGNKMQAAQMLGIAVSTLYDKLRRYRWSKG